jgi:hypothetical protein
MTKTSVADGRFGDANHLHKEVSMSCCIGQGRPSSSEITASIRQAPLPAVRQLLTDERILDTCRQCQYTRYRERRFGPVVTVLHFVAAKQKTGQVPMAVN